MSIDWPKLAGYGFSMVPTARRGKRPILSWREFQERRPTEAELADWARRPSNAAIVTGQISGIVVLDVDTDEAAAEVARRGLPRTPTVRTAKGRHYYLRHPGGRISNFGHKRLAGCDLKGDGGLVTAPGSVHPSGVVYAWELSPDDVEFAEPPVWLLKLVRERPDPAPPPPPRSTADAYAKAAMDRELAALRWTPEGTRNETLNCAAFSLGQIVGAGALDEVTVERHLLATAHAIGLGSEGGPGHRAQRPLRGQSGAATNLRIRHPFVRPGGQRGPLCPAAAGGRGREPRYRRRTRPPGGARPRGVRPGARGGLRAAGGSQLDARQAGGGPPGASQWRGGRQRHRHDPRPAGTLGRSQWTGHGCSTGLPRPSAATSSCRLWPPMPWPCGWCTRTATMPRLARRSWRW